MRFERYECYKDIGLEWLQSIPNEWSIDRIKNIGSVKGRVGWKALKASEYVDKSDYIFIATPNIKHKDIDFKNVNYLTQERYEESPEIMLKLDDIVLTKDGSTLGTVNIISYLPSKTTVNSSIAVLRFKTVNSKFMFYQIKSEYIQNIVKLKKDGAGVPHLFQKDINNFNIILPPLKTQQKIATYLETQTQKIDKEINLLKQKIEKYKELKQTLINETVLRGLDKGVELKDSGVEWIGEIPKGWEVKRLKDIGFIYSGLTGKKGDDFKQEDSHLNKPYIPFTNIAKNKYIQIEDVKQVLVDENESQNRVKKNDLFFLMSSEGYEDIGKSSLLLDNSGEMYLNSFCKGFRIKHKDVNNIFINYLLSSSKLRDLMIVGGKGFTRINLKIEKIIDFKILLPSNNEQIEIANYLDEKTQKIDNITETITDKIELLKEFRKTLVNDVVTGRVKV